MKKSHNTHLMQLMRVQHYLINFRKMIYSEVNAGFKPLREVFNHALKAEELYREGRGCRTLTKNDLLNVLNHMLKILPNSVLRDKHVQEFEQLTHVSQTSSRRRSVYSVAVAEHVFVVHLHHMHRMLSSGYANEKKFNQGQCLFKACENIKLHKNWILLILTLQQRNAMIMTAVDVYLGKEKMIIDCDKFECFEDVKEEHALAHRSNTKIIKKVTFKWSICCN